MPLGPVAERVRARMDALQPLFESIPTNAPPRVRAYAALARSQVSMAGNNAAFLLLSRDLKEEAFDLFERVRAFEHGMGLVQ